MKLSNLLKKYSGIVYSATIIEQQQYTAVLIPSEAKEPLDNKIVELPKNVYEWPEEWIEAYEERAAIMEYDGCMSRVQAEKKAKIIVYKAYIN